jgi:cyclase
MLTKRIIPCLDIRDGQTVKGVNFVDIRAVGDPVALAAAYAVQGADELVFLDITATVDGRKTLASLVERIAKEINIPFTVGGGVRTIEDAKLLLGAGADKISVNSAAFRDPSLVTGMAGRYGNQCVVVAIDTKFEDGNWRVFLDGGRTNTGRLCLEWAREVAERGAGEILLTSMNNGTKAGFALDITRLVSESIGIPVIASGGAGTVAHFTEVFREGKADAALAASIFHYGEIRIADLKNELAAEGIRVRV